MLLLAVRLSLRRRLLRLQCRDLSFFSVGVPRTLTGSTCEIGPGRRNRLAVVARIARAELHAARAVVRYCLPVPEARRPPRQHLDLMPESGERIARLPRNRALHLHVAPLERRFREAPRLQRLLDVHPEVRDVDHELRVRLRLVPSAHDAEPDPDVVLLHESGNDRVQRPLAARERVRVARLEREEAAATLQHETDASGRQTRAESLIVTLDERNDVPFAISDAPIDGVAPTGSSDASQL